MEQVVQTLIVALLVIGSAVYAAWRLAPARMKLRALNGLNPSDANAVGRWLMKLRRRVTEELAQGCSACSKSAEHVKKYAAQPRR
jgi:hypothetical protein